MAQEQSTPTCKKLNLDKDIIIFTKINSVSIIDLNLKCNTLKLLECKRRKSRWPWFLIDFLGTTPKAQSVTDKN